MPMLLVRIGGSLEVSQPGTASTGALRLAGLVQLAFAVDVDGVFRMCRLIAPGSSAIRLRQRHRTGARPRHWKRRLARTCRCIRRGRSGSGRFPAFQALLQFGCDPIDLVLL